MDRSGPVVHRSFLFTDIEGSTRLWERFPTAMPQALRLHDRLLQETVSARGGTVFKTVGDAICAVFPSPAQAVLAAVEAQRRLAGAAWHDLGLPEQIRVRMAIHAGEVQEHDGDFAGPVLNRLARLLAAGHGGQVLIAGPVAEQVRGVLPEHGELRDLGERRLRDVPGTERIVQLAIGGLPSTFPPLRTLETIPHILPAVPTPCIGREEELRQLRALFPRSASRLVTLLGPGGIGKTRLALQAATDLLDEFSDGVWFVDLTSVREAGLVASTVVRSLGLREEAGRSAEETLLAWLEQRELLLVLDNCEQVIEGVAHMAASVLRDAPQVRVLATSRAPLGVRGEQRMPVEPLALPGDETEPDSQQVQETASVQLFVARARAVRPAFALSTANAPHVAAICRRVDGIPLALELAAARVTVLSPEALRERLDLLLPTLRSGARDVPERHQTLRDAIRWSYELLSPGEQKVFRRLAIFGGGWSLTAAAAVLGHDLEADLLDVLESLTAQSLIRTAPGEHEVPRFSMLETIREFAVDQLAASDALDAMHQAHAGWCLALAEDLEWKVDGPQHRSAIHQLNAEHANMQAALAWFETQTRSEEFLRLAGALMPFWHTSGYLSEAVDWLEGALAMDEAPRPTAARAKALVAAGQAALLGGDFVRARKQLNEGIRVAKSQAAAEIQVRGLYWLGSAALFENDFDQGFSLSTECLDVSLKSDNQLGAAFALWSLGFCALSQGDYSLARWRLSESVSLSREIGSPTLMAFVQCELANLDYRQGEYAPAQSWATDSLLVAREAEHQVAISQSLGLLTEVARAQGDFTRAATIGEEHVALMRSSGMSVPLAWGLRNLAFATMEEGFISDAIQLFSESLTLFLRHGSTLGIASCILGLASVAAKEKRYERAARMLSAVDQMLGEADLALAPADRDAYDRAVQTTQLDLGANAWQAEAIAGRQMPTEGVIEEAWTVIREY
jgi:predicted ATPase/class 3 adenylate cyclase